MPFPYTVVELRNYRLHPGRRDELIDLFERQFIEPQEAVGAQLLGLFRDADRPDAFVWFRAFAGMEERKRALEAFYGGPVWQRHRDAANVTMADSDNVLLLRPLGLARGMGAASVRGPILCATKLHESREALLHSVRRFDDTIAERIAAAGGEILAAFVSEEAVNTFPRLPVREGEHALVFVTSGLTRENATAEFDAGDVMELVPAARSRVQLSFAGEPGDFDFLTSMRTVTHRRSRERTTVSAGARRL